MGEELRAACSSADRSVMIGNRWLKRRFGISEGVATTEYSIRPWGRGAWLPMFSFIGAYPFDAEVVLDGTLLRVGPWKHEHYGHESDWTYGHHAVRQTQSGVRLDIRMRPRTGAPNVELVLHQQVPHAAPCLKRWLTLRNLGSKPVRVNRMVVEVVPGLRVGREIDVVDAYVAPKVADSPDFIGWRTHEFDLGPDVAVEAGGSFESYPVYTLVSSGGIEERLSAVNALLRAEAPWTTRPVLRHLFGREAPWRDILALGERSRSLGFEALVSFVGVHFTNTGDFALNPAVFPNGEEDLRRLVDGLHGLGMKFIMYVGFCIANRGSKVREEHLDWEMTGPEGRTYDPGGVGNMCPSSGWGKFFLRKCRWLTDEVGVDGLETDGCYYGQPCHRTDHNHQSPGEAQYRNWRFEMDFYREMREKGKIIETPSRLYALLHGAVSIPQGYHEEDQEELALFDLVTAFRNSLYTGQMRGLPGWAAWGFAAIDPYHGHGLWPPEEHLVEFEHLIAGHFGYGLSAFMYGWDLANGPESRRILQRWIGFFRRYRDTLAGDAVFLHPPSGSRPDAMLHVRPGGEIPAVLVAFNPVGRPVRAQWSVPLWRAGLEGTVSVSREGGGEDAAVVRLDDVGNIVQEMTLAPYQVAWWEYRTAHEQSRGRGS